MRSHLGVAFLALTWPLLLSAANTKPQNYDIRDDDSPAAVETLDRHLQRHEPGHQQKKANAQQAFANALKHLGETIPGADVIPSAHTGGPEVVGVARGRGKLTPGGGENREQVLRKFLLDHADLYGLEPNEIAHLVKTADYANPAGNLTWLTLERRVKGRKVFRGELEAAFTPAGELVRTSGELPVLIDDSDAADAAIVTAPEAIAVAAASIGIDVAPADLHLSGDDGTSVSYTGGPFVQPIRAELQYFPLDAGAVDLVWSMTLWLGDDAYWVLVSAEIPDVLFRKNISEDQAQPATYSVYNAASPAPLVPSTALPGSGFQAPGILRTSFTLISELPLFDNLGWMTDGVNTTTGNNVDAGLDLAAPDGIDADGRPVGSPFRVFDFPYNPPPLGTDAPSSVNYRWGEVTHMFFWANRYHDLLYQLGFTEAARNFQTNNFGRGGIGNDAISAEAQDFSGTNNANFAVGADGTLPRMQLYLFTGPDPARTATLEQDVLLHELTHGTSLRLHANGSGLNSAMSPRHGRGMVGLLRQGAHGQSDRGRERHLSVRAVGHVELPSRLHGQLLLRLPALPLRGDVERRRERPPAQPADVRRHRSDADRFERRSVPEGAGRIAAGLRGARVRRSVGDGALRNARAPHSAPRIRHRQSAHAAAGHRRDEARSAESDVPAGTRFDPRRRLRVVRRRRRARGLERVRRARHGLQRARRRRDHEQRHRGVRRSQSRHRHAGRRGRELLVRRRGGSRRDDRAADPRHQSSLRAYRERRDTLDRWGIVREPGNDSAGRHGAGQRDLHGADRHVRHDHSSGRHDHQQLRSGPSDVRPPSRNADDLRSTGDLHRGDAGVDSRRGQRRHPDRRDRHRLNPEGRRQSPPLSPADAGSDPHPHRAGRNARHADTQSRHRQRRLGHRCQQLHRHADHVRRRRAVSHCRQRDVRRLVPSGNAAVGAERSSDERHVDAARHRRQSQQPRHGRLRAARHHQTGVLLLRRARHTVHHPRRDHGDGGERDAAKRRARSRRDGDGAVRAAQLRHGHHLESRGHAAAERPHPRSERAAKLRRGRAAGHAGVASVHVRGPRLVRRHVPRHAEAAGRHERPRHHHLPHAHRPAAADDDPAAQFGISQHPRYAACVRRGAGVDLSLDDHRSRIDRSDLESDRHPLQLAPSLSGGCRRPAGRAGRADRRAHERRGIARRPIVHVHLRRQRTASHLYERERNVPADEQCAGRRLPRPRAGRPVRLRAVGVQRNESGRNVDAVCRGRYQRPFQQRVDGQLEPHDHHTDGDLHRPAVHAELPGAGDGGGGSRPAGSDRHLPLGIGQRRLRRGHEQSAVAFILPDRDHDGDRHGDARRRHDDDVHVPGPSPR